MSGLSTSICFSFSLVSCLIKDTLNCPGDEDWTGLNSDLTAQNERQHAGSFQGWLHKQLWRHWNPSRALLGTHGFDKEGLQ